MNPCPPDITDTGSDASDPTTLRWIPGDRPGTATRVRLHDEDQGQDGEHGEQTVRVEQMVFHAELGWYVQKSITVTADVAGALGLALREAHCILPKTQRTGSLKLHPAMPGPNPHRTRRNA